MGRYLRGITLFCPEIKNGSVIYIYADCLVSLYGYKTYGCGRVYLTALLTVDRFPDLALDLHLSSFKFPILHATRKNTA